MGEQICIYCRETDKPFAQEHVIPQSFGTFNQNFTLTNEVCKECNQFFGDNLESYLGRGSGEGLARWKHGIKSPKEFKNLWQSRFKTTVRNPGNWKGARIDPIVPGSVGVDPDPKPQVGFRSETNDEVPPVWLTEDELSEQTVKRFKTGKWRVTITGPTRVDIERLREKIHGLGIPFTEKGKIDSPLTTTGTLLVEMETTVDEPIIRCVSKIAFNYLTYIHKARFVLSADFDQMRRFIRYGERPSWFRMGFANQPILFDDRQRERQTNGHLITIDWDGNGSQIMGQVSLFNTATYKIPLCSRYHGTWFMGLKSGHHFDIDNWTISPLHNASLVVPVIFHP